MIIMTTVNMLSLHVSMSSEPSLFWSSNLGKTSILSEKSHFTENHFIFIFLNCSIIDQFHCNTGDIISVCKLSLRQDFLLYKYQETFKNDKDKNGKTFFLSLQFYFSLNSFNSYIPLGHLKPMSPIFPPSWPRDHLNPIYNIILPGIGNFIQAFWLKKCTLYMYVFGFK